MVDSENLGHAADEVPPSGASAGGPNDDATVHYGDEFAAQLAALDGGISTEEVDAIAALPSGSALLIVRRGPKPDHLR